MPLKRAAIACKFCRNRYVYLLQYQPLSQQVGPGALLINLTTTGRKRKCDGKLPRCTNCDSMQVECTYEERPRPRVDQTKRLETIERLLQAHSNAIADLSRSLQRDGTDVNSDRVYASEHRSSPSSNHNANAHGRPTAATPEFFLHRGAVPRPTLGDSLTLPLFTIPFGHQTTTSSLLVLPQVRSLAGNFPHDIFFRVEASRPFLGDMFTMGSSNRYELPVLDRTITDRLLEQYFTLVHQFHPLLERDALMSQYQNALDRGLQLDEESALCLVALALGAIASEPRQRNGEFERETPGFVYFQPALNILFATWANSFGNNIVLAQGLVLSALYLLHLMRPLQGWRLIHMASTNIQQTLIRSEQLSKAQRESILRICWSCFLIECDNLAEFDHPRSGIEPLVDNMPFPGCGNPPDSNVQHYLANLSARCLLNRIHHSIYFTSDVPTGNPRHSSEALDVVMSLPQLPSSSLIRVCTELDHQLQTWYDMLPDTIRPDLDLHAQSDPPTCLLRLRYWSARQIIYRPFVIYAITTTADQEHSSVILDNCQACLSSCRAYIHAMADLLSTPSPYAYLASQCCLGSILILTLARRSPMLEHLVPDIDTLQNIAIGTLELWRISGSSIEYAHEIAMSIREKQQFPSQISRPDK
ncbi:unnamed protein product [Penicillium salamii]|nr:unnamed protein product [Penicillium salamii]CAG8239636.1 unnamed protein product [Penicillium salamii]